MVNMVIMYIYMVQSWFKCRFWLLYQFVKMKSAVEERCQFPTLEICNCAITEPEKEAQG